MNWVGRLYLWACERLYHELAWGYDLVSWLVSAGQWRRWQESAWHHVVGRDVLEIGAGTGALLAAGARRGLKMVGLDLSPAMLAVATRRLITNGAAASFVRADARRLPLPDGAFDTVLATFPAGYIFAPETLAEMWRVLRPGGRVVVVGVWVELHVAFARWLPVFFGRPKEEARTAILARVDAAGFRSQWIEHRIGHATVGTLVAERRSGNVA